MAWVAVAHSKRRIANHELRTTDYEPSHPRSSRQPRRDPQVFDRVNLDGGPGADENNPRPSADDRDVSLEGPGTVPEWDLVD